MTAVRMFMVACIAGLVAASGAAAAPIVEARGSGQRPAVFWLGESFRGLPLTARTQAPGGPGFIYGDCDPGSSDTGCHPPLAVQNWQLRRRHPAMFDRSFPCQRLTVRGVPAAFFASSQGLDLYTGRRTIAIFGDSRRLMLQAARGLRSVGGTWRARLPRPAIPVADALRRCTPIRPTLAGRA